ncbi:MAG: hypothetical protein KAT16_00075 [Candidatus Heimdallarchaeota archaeon]|nr:hypothetical protein [Candidatus Heimdallarchaeota archaeon]
MLQDYLRLVSNSILIIGPAKSGKTTMLRRLQSGDFVEQVKPTLGFSSDIIKNTPVIEIGGQKAYKNFWQKAISNIPALTLFVIDISKELDFNGYKKFRENFQGLKKCLLIANKVDLIETRNHPRVETLHKEDIEVIFCSARTGENFWRLSETIAEFCSKYTPKKQTQWKALPELKRNPSDLDDYKDRDKALKLLEKYKERF